MANVSYIEKTYIETEVFQEPTTDLVLRIKLSDGEEVLFTAEKEFYTPRRIATNKPDVLVLDNVVEYTPNNVAIIKMQNGQTDINKPQYYINSIVRDVYKQYELDNFFTELDDELDVPDFIGTLAEQRQFALNALLNLEDLAAAAAVGDIQAIDEAAADIDENFSELAGLENVRRVLPSQITTPEEEDQLAALDFVGLTSGPGSVPGGFVAKSRPSTSASPVIDPITGLPTAPIDPATGQPVSSTSTPRIDPVTGQPVFGSPAPSRIDPITGNPVSPETPIIAPDGSVVPAGNIVRTGPGINDYYIADSNAGAEIPPYSALTDDGGLFASADTSDDIIDPVPTIGESAVIRMGAGIRPLESAIPGLETINSGISTINLGAQQIEDSMRGSTGTNNQGQDEMITVAPGKEAYTSSGGEYTGVTPERTIPRSSVEKRLADVDDDIQKQENTPYTILETLSGVPTLIRIQKSTLFSKLVNNLSSAGVMATLSKTVGYPILTSNVKGTETNAEIPTGYRPMQREHLLNILYKTKAELEKTLSS